MTEDVERLRSAVARDPENPQLAGELAEALLGLGRLDEVEEILRRVAEKHPRFA